MAWTDLLDNNITYLLIFELVVTFVVFGVFLALFWIIGEIPMLQFDMQSFLNDHGLVLFLTLGLYRIGDRVFRTVMDGV